MDELFSLYEYIKGTYDSYQEIKYTGTEIIVRFHDEFEMEIRLQNAYNIYFNNFFYYNIDWQDMKDTIDEIMTNQYVFCERRKKIKVFEADKFIKHKKYNHIWTIKETLK